MTDKERYEYTSGKYLECTKEINTVRKGEGCKVGEHYCFEYVHDTDDGERPDADAFYRKLSDNNRYDEVFISDEELLNNFTLAKKNWKWEKIFRFHIGKYDIVFLNMWNRTHLIFSGANNQLWIQFRSSSHYNKKGYWNFKIWKQHNDHIGC